MDRELLKIEADKAIAEHPEKRVLSFTYEGKLYWIKRKLSNGRNQLVKYSVEKEFYYEIARMAIARDVCPSAVPVLALLTPSYMVTEDGGTDLGELLRSGLPEAEKEILISRAAKTLALLHKGDVVHGRPALRDITVSEEKVTFLDWENRLYSSKLSEQKAIDFLLFLHTICRENFETESSRVNVAMAAYTEEAGMETFEEAKAYLRKHQVVGKLTHLVSPFGWKDVESVRKLYDYLLDAEVR